MCPKSARISRAPGPLQDAGPAGRPAGYPLRSFLCNWSSPCHGRDVTAARRSATGARVPGCWVRSKAGRFRVPTREGGCRPQASRSGLGAKVGRLTRHMTRKTLTKGRYPDYTAAQMKPIRFDRHARRRMLQRGITDVEIEMVLREPQRIQPSIKGRLNAFGRTVHGMIRVTFRETPDGFIVITAIRQRGTGGSSP